MREWRILCDKCGEEIKGNPIVLDADRTDRADKGVSVDTICEGVELCDKCWQDISDAIILNLPIKIADESTPTQEAEQALDEKTKNADEPEAEEAPRKYMKLDHGKIQALRNAGWTYKQIADEMHCTTAQVNNSLMRHKKEVPDIGNN